MTTKEELKELLKEIRSAGDIEGYEEELKEKLRGVTAAELSRAEQDSPKRRESRQRRSGGSASPTWRS